MGRKIIDLFNSYCDEYQDGSHPDVLAYLGEAGEGREALVWMIDHYLQSAPIPPADPRDVALMREWIKRINN
jgi:hypothetical protein